MRIGWVGLGRLGLPCALALAEYGGHDVLGYDVNEQAARALETGVWPHTEQRLTALLAGYNTTDTSQHPRFTHRTLGEVVHHADVIFVAVQTPHAPGYDGSQPTPDEPRDFEYGFLVQAVRDIAAQTTRQQRTRPLTVAIVSTVLPNTCSRLLQPLIRPPLRLAYTPSFIAMGTTIPDFLDPEFRLIGADDDDAYKDVARVWGGLGPDQGTAPVLRTSVVSAEVVKITYNTFLGAKLVFANAVMEVCHDLGADVDEVTVVLGHARRRLMSTAYLSGGMGDGGGCFPPGETVITEHGPRPIEQIQVGNLVLTYDGTLQPVLKTWERDYDGDLVRVKVQGLLEARMTADHPVMARSDLRHLRPDGRKVTHTFPRSEVAEVAAADLTADHLLRWPEHEVREYPLPEHVTADYLELAGWYLAEGSTDLSERRGRLRWDLHVDEVMQGERIAELAVRCAPPRLSGRGGNACVTIEVHPQAHRRTVRFGSMGLARQLVADFGKGARDKSLPPWALWGDQKIAALLLDGLLNGDGHINRRGIAYSTISPHLAWGVHLLMTRLGARPTIREVPARPGHQHSYEVRVRNRYDAAALAAHVPIGIIEPGLHRVRGDDWRPIRKLAREHYSGPVHNLWVAGTNTYVAGCGAVHNCHPRDQLAMSWLARRLGLSFDLFGTLMQARDAQTRWLAELACEWAALTRLPVVVLGKAYKPGTSLTAGSPAALFVHHLDNCNPEVRASWYDPHVDGGRFEGFIDPAVFVIATKHPEWVETEFAAGSVVIDPWRYMPDADGVTVVRVGRR